MKDVNVVKKIFEKTSLNCLTVLTFFLTPVYKESDTYGIPTSYYLRGKDLVSNVDD